MFYGLRVSARTLLCVEIAIAAVLVGTTAWCLGPYGAGALAFCLFPMSIYLAPLAGRQAFWCSCVLTYIWGGFLCALGLSTFDRPWWLGIVVMVMAGGGSFVGASCRQQRFFLKASARTQHDLDRYLSEVSEEGGR